MEQLKQFTFEFCFARARAKWTEARERDRAREGEPPPLFEPVVGRGCYDFLEVFFFFSRFSSIRFNSGGGGVLEKYLRFHRAMRHERLINKDALCSALHARVRWLSLSLFLNLEDLVIVLRNDDSSRRFFIRADDIVLFFLPPCSFPSKNVKYVDAFCNGVSHCLIYSDICDICI